METRYYLQEHDIFVTPQVNFEEFFNEYGRIVSNIAPNQKYKNGIAVKCRMSAEEVKAVEQLARNIFPSYAGKKKQISSKPDFKSTFCDIIPDFALSLKSLQAVHNRTESDLKRLKRKVLYCGEVDVEDTIYQDKQNYQSKIDLFPHNFYLLTLRIYLPVQHSKYLYSARPKEFRVSQEFLCLSSGDLDILRDRIACSNDFQSVDGDISHSPLQRTSIRARDVHRSAMFYIGNDFFIDRRYTSNLDYSAPVRKWGKGEGFEFGSVKSMETSSIYDLKNIRLGYPYLYMHQGNCEHLIVFTDARLLHHRDPFDSTQYPFLIGFGSLKSRYCFSCMLRVSRYVVVDNDRQPEDAAHMCTSCLHSYNYKDGEKRGNFKLYSYLDRTALL